MCSRSQARCTTFEGHSTHEESFSHHFKTCADKMQLGLCSLHDNPPTGNSSTYFREITAPLLKELDGVEREGDEVEKKCFFVREADGEKEQIWVSFDGPRFMMKNHEQNMLSVQRWIENME